MQIIYEDNHLIAVNKECGEIVQGDKTGDVTLIDKVKAYVKKKYNKSGDVYLGSPHRLDRPSSGIVVFTRTSKALTRMNKMFQDKGTIKKIYWAVVDVLPAREEDTLENYIFRNESKNKCFICDNPKKGAKACSLTYHHIASLDHYHLLEIELHTGRHHQIRAQLANIGCHIKGDLKYGAARSNKNGGIHLHARRMEFIHPVSKKLVVIVANPPIEDPVWKAIMETQK